MKKFQQFLTRRSVLSGAGLAAAGLGRAESRGVLEAERPDVAMKIRHDSASSQNAQPHAVLVGGGDETSVPRWSACFTKGLPTSQDGEVEPGAYETLLRAIESGKHADFERIARGSGRRLVSPQAAYAFHLEGGDSHRFAVAPPPAFGSAEAAAETSELYWQALCRDVPFAQYGESALVQRATESLGATPATVFRGPSPGDRDGPHLSQFLAKPIPMGSTKLEQRYRAPQEGSDFITSFGEWLQIQTGVPPWREVNWDPTPRYIRNGRDLAEWAHYDFLYQAFLNAALILMDYRPESALHDTRSVLSELNPYKHSKVQDGFVTFGLAQVVDLLGRVATAALKATWAQKWLVHRRLRPEAFGGRIHQTRSKVVEYPVHPDLLNSMAVEETYGRWGELPAAAGLPGGVAAAPVLPRWPRYCGGCFFGGSQGVFDEAALIADCVHASADGLSLVPCPSSFAPTIGAEVNKLVFNVAIGRSWAGIHYGSDTMAGVRLGEDVAIAILRDLVRTFTEDFDGFAFTRVDGTRVKVSPNGEVALG